MTTATADKITREQIEAKFRELSGDVDERAEDAKERVIGVGAIIGAAVLIGVFLWGRSRGRRKTTIVEVRRF